MCGSTNTGRSLAFSAAAAFLAANAAETIGTEAPKGVTRSKIEFIASLGGPEAPRVVADLADAEDVALGLAREVQKAQASIFATLLGGGVVGSYDGDVEDLVASINNLKTADDAVNAARKAVEAERDRVLAEEASESDADPVLQ